MSDKNSHNMERSFNAPKTTVTSSTKEGSLNFSNNAPKTTITVNAKSKESKK
jgi:hypothetical protein